MATPCYIFDIDGTLANGDHRLHHIQKQPKDWDAFFEACDADLPHMHIIQLARDILAAGTPIVFVSGRSDQVIVKTVDWLQSQINHPNIHKGCRVYMRKAGDHKNDDELKIELLAELRKDGYEPIMAFDDRNRVVKAWREAGIPCAQVAEGDF